MGKVTTSLKIDPQLRDEARRVAANRRLTLGNIIEEALTAYGQPSRGIDDTKWHNDDNAAQSEPEDAEFIDTAQKIYNNNILTSSSNYHLRIPYYPLIE